MFTKGFQTDLWFGLSEYDVVEMGLWDRDKKQIGWNTLYQSKSYDTVTVAYYNTLNNVVTYSYQALKPDYILHKTEDILMDPADQVSASFHIPSGSFFITYNTTREMAGNPDNPLVIKDIAPSRKELKLYPISNFNDSYTAFCQHKFLMNDVSSLYVNLVKDCPYGNIFNKVSPLYTNEVNTIKNLFFIPSDGGMLMFFKNIYEDLLLYSSTPVLSVAGLEIVSQNFIRIQGISTYFNNYLLSNSTMVVDFDVIDTHFQGFVSASIERKFSAAGSHPSQEYVNAKAFVYDYFTKYFYTPISTVLRAAYNDKYFGYFKNALNVGDNRLLPILSVGMMDERTSPTDPLTLLVKLKDELPTDLPAQTHCWVSNISLIPHIVSAIIKADVSQIVHTIGPPNFSIPTPNASLTNTNMAYTANDLKQDDTTERQLAISKNINELSVDYTNFSNFVVFSSAEMRLKIFKNKAISLYGLSASLEILNDTAATFLGASGSIYPYYDKEYVSIQGQMDSIVGTFDGYESYLYNQGSYDYENGAFVSASYVADQDTAATEYDKDNRDSLVNTCPEHVLSNSDNDDYIIFLSMVGHFFDDIYIYIANMPSEKKLGNDPTSEFTRRVVDYMLSTFGWKQDDSLEQANLLNNYLTSDQMAGLNQMSAEERLKTIRNRILNTLPQIFKTKGTEEAIKLILACYGIPSVLLSVREYGGVTYDDPKASYTLYERVYMRQWDTSSKYDSYDLQLPTGSHTYLFKVSVDGSEPYTYDKEQILFGRVEGTNRQAVAGSGEWAVGFVRIPKQNTGQLFFRIGNKSSEAFKMYSQEFPLFDGNIYSVMLRRNYPDLGFEFDPNYDAIPAKYDLFVKRNEFGNQLVNLTSSAVCYDTASNIRFGNGGLLKIGGWFADQNGQGYTGCFDKFQVWRDPVPDSNVEDYTNNFSAYSYRGTGSIPYESLYFRMHTDYPFNQLDTGMWVNGNPYFAISSSTKLNTLYGESDTNVDYLVSSMAWSGSTKIVDGLCGPVSQSVYPYQFKVIDYPSTWGISKYGPNRFRNEKTRFVSQSVEARFDNLDRSTYVDPSATAPDSNQVGFFVDPQDFKNRDIVRYFGNFDFMDAIGDPGYQYSESYDSLRMFRKEYSSDRNQYSGSRTLFNEILTTYKLYFNRSVFESIKNVIPARTNALLGVVIEPTILERPKYQLKPIDSSADFAMTASMNHYAFDSASLVVIGAGIIPSQSLNLNLGYLSLPNADYPVNYGGNYIRDMSDDFEHGHFAAGVPPRTIDFSAYLLCYAQSLPLVGYAPLTVQFVNNSFGATKYVWNFGDGHSSTKFAPSHSYDESGTYTVTLTGTYGAFGLHKILINYVTVTNYIITAGFDASPKTGTAPLEVSFSNLSTNADNYYWQFGSGSATSTAFGPTQSFMDAGTYTVMLTARTNPIGCSNIYSDVYTSASYIVVAPQPDNCGGTYLQDFAGGNFGDKSFNQQYVGSLGHLTTPVTFSYNVATSASRYVVTINGNTMLDTLWLCSGSADQTMVDSINDAMAPYGPSPTPAYLSASISPTNNLVATPGSGTLYFNKTDAFNITTVNVYNPFNTTCSYTMSCPTPEPPPIVIPPTLPCGGAISPSGNAVPYPYYKDYPIQLGSGTGTVVLTFSAYTVPDRFQVIYDGVVVINPQGYWNGAMSSGNNNYRAALNALGFTEAIRTAPPPAAPGAWSDSFVKTTNTPYAILRVWSPLAGTAWTAKLACPV
jgi:PKD repeat protein